MTNKELIQEKWNKVGITVEFKNISHKRQMPNIETMPKDQIVIGVKRNKVRDTVYINKKELSMTLSLNVHFEDLVISDLKGAGVIPSLANQTDFVCNQCNEITSSTWLGGYCFDCYSSNKARAKENAN